MSHYKEPAIPLICSSLFFVCCCFILFWDTASPCSPDRSWTGGNTPASASPTLWFQAFTIMPPAGLPCVWRLSLKWGHLWHNATLMINGKNDSWSLISWNKKKNAYTVCLLNSNKLTDTWALPLCIKHYWWFYFCVLVSINYGCLGNYSVISVISWLHFLKYKFRKSCFLFLNVNFKNFGVLL